MALWLTVEAVQLAGRASQAGLRSIYVPETAFKTIAGNFHERILTQPRTFLSAIFSNPQKCKIGTKSKESGCVFAATKVLTITCLLILEVGVHVC